MVVNFRAEEPILDWIRIRIRDIREAGSHTNSNVVVVYQCTIINVMVSLGELKLFCIVVIITLPWPGLWQVHTQCGIPHINAYLLLVGRRNGSVFGVHEYRLGLNI